MLDASHEKYVCVFRGSRDDYQVAAALAESGRLRTLFTDFYTPDALASSRWGRRLAHRHHALVPSRLTTMIPWGALPLHKSIFDRWDYDAAIGRAAARRSTDPAVVYSYYAAGFMEERAERGISSNCVVFQVHPVAEHVRAVLSADRERSGISDGLEGEEQFDQARLDREAWVLRNAAGVIAASTFTLEGLRDMGVPANRLHVAPYGSPPTPTRGPGTRAPRQANTPLRLLWVGQLSYRKGPHWLLKAMDALGPRVAQLTMVTRSAVPTWLQPLPQNVHIVRASGSELGELRRSHELFIMPSLIEGFGLVYLEAMSAGLPIVATRNSGAPDIVDDGHNAVFVEPGDWEAIASCLTDLRERPDELRLLQERCARARLPSWSDFRKAVVAALDAIDVEAP